VLQVAATSGKEASTTSLRSASMTTPPAWRCSRQPSATSLMLTLGTYLGPPFSNALEHWRKQPTTDIIQSLQPGKVQQRLQEAFSHLTAQMVITTQRNKD
jgi:hypothetical protein